MKNCSSCQKRLTLRNRDLATPKESLCSDCAKKRANARRKASRVDAASEVRDKQVAISKRLRNENEDRQRRDEEAEASHRERIIKDRRLEIKRAKVRRAMAKQVAICTLICIAICSLFGYFIRHDTFGLSPDAQLRKIVDRTTVQLESLLASEQLGISRNGDGWSVTVENETDFRKRAESPLVATLKYGFAAIEDMKPDENGRSSYRVESCTFVYRYSWQHERWFRTNVYRGNLPYGSKLLQPGRYRFFRDKEMGYWSFTTR